jgi:hypothetical protein
MGSGFGGDQPSWNRSKALAAARGGARAGKPRWVSNRVRCQAILGFQGKLDLSMAFMMLGSLRMEATITTFVGFLAAFRRSAKARRMGLHRITATVDMYSTQRASARPPQMTRLPPVCRCRWPGEQGPRVRRCLCGPGRPTRAVWRGASRRSCRGCCKGTSTCVRRFHGEVRERHESLRHDRERPLCTPRDAGRMREPLRVYSRPLHLRTIKRQHRMAAISALRTALNRFSG